MARVILEPIGSDLDGASRASDESRARMEELDAALDARRAAVRSGWGERYQERTRRKGKMTVWERVEALADPGSTIRPIGTFVNHGEAFGDEPNTRTSPAAGVVTAFVRVSGLWCCVIANDNTVASGSWWPRTPEKIIRAQEIALKLRVPVIYLVDCSGLFLPEQGRNF